jgi:plasmid stabilization system protein ParE
MGRPGRVDGTRELVLHHSYLIAYRVTETAVEIIHVRHAARRWPSAFPDDAPER